MQIKDPDPNQVDMDQIEYKTTAKIIEREKFIFSNIRSDPNLDPDPVSNGKDPNH